MSTNVWQVVRREDGTFDLFHNGKLLHGSVPDRWLESQLGRSGFCGREYGEIRRQLEESGTAEIAL